MYYSYIETEVTGLNRKAIAGESQGQITPQDLVWGMETQKYKMVGSVFTPKSQEDIDELESEKVYKSSLENKLKELKDELESRMDSAKPKSNSKKDLKLVSRQLKLVLRKLEGRATEAEIAEIAASEVLDDYLDDATDVYDVAEVWLEDASRTLLEIEGYDVSVDPNWPIGA